MAALHYMKSGFGYRAVLEEAIMNEKITQILNWLEDYKNKTHCEGVVLGISGGKDSTVVAMLAKKVWGDKVVGVMMPNGKQTDLEDSIAICNTLKLNSVEVNIGSVTEPLLKVIHDSVPFTTVSKQAATNIPPRIRMTTLYAIAQSLGYRVIGTGNASEAYIGWTTKWGDSAYDLNPIYHLTCSEVVEIGQELSEEFGLDKKYVSKAPSDGLTGKSDEDNFGFTYAYLDSVIKGEAEANDAVKRLHASSAHKRVMPYTMKSKA